VTYYTQRSLLTGHTSRTAIFTYAAHMGWRLVLEEGDPAVENYRAHFGAAPGVEFRYVEDLTSRQRYVYIASSTDDGAAILAGFVADDIDTMPLQQFLDACDATEDLEHGRALMRLGVAAPYEHSPDVFNRINAGMQHDDARVRRLAVWATTYSPWPAYLRALRTIATSDPDPALRDRAHGIVEIFENHGASTHHPEPSHRK
jgi:hypothetical protein